MNAPFYQQILDGRSAAPEPLIELRAGELDLLYDNGSLRHINLNGIPVLHQIYAAVRDHNWGTVPGIMHDAKLEIAEDNFFISYTIHHRQDDIDFIWRATITGRANSTIEFAFDGTANSSFRRNRIGFCVLHPMVLAGQSCVVEHVDGSITNGHFPDLILPHQPFFNIRAIQHEVVPGLRARVVMDGDIFEMEDQRNWTDASYKTYCTPLGQPFPVTIEASTRVSQAITLRLSGDVPRQECRHEPLTVEISDREEKLPALGLGLPSHGEQPEPEEVAQLRQLNLAHLRAEIRFAAGDVKQQLHDAAQYAEKLQTALDLAIFLPGDAGSALKTVAEWLKMAEVPVVRIAIFHQDEKSTQRQWVELARKILGESAISIGAGTDAFFTELNRERPPAELLDFVTYSLNPQVHAFDNLSLIETLATQPETVRTARSFSQDAKIVVGPVTLKMRSNPNATGPAAPVPPGELPPQVDPRQMSLFGAAWTLGSLKVLAQSGGVQAVTYYETTGWCGVMARASGSPLPEKFPALSGAVFPMYHVFRACADFAGGTVRRSRSNQPLKVECLVLKKEGRQRILLANLTPEPQVVWIKGISGTYTLRLLDAEQFESATLNPGGFWAASKPFDDVSLSLPPYALAILDQK